VFRRLFGSGQSRTPASAQRSAKGGAGDSHVAVLARVPLFIDLSRRELQRLAITCAQRDYAAGDALVRQSQPGAGLFVVVSGGVRVSQHGEGGDERELSRLGPGEVFGEMTLLDDLPRSATVTAAEPTRVLILPVQDFRAALREEPDITVRLLAVLSRRLRHADAQLV
jgi:CRP-like cAMP-binding protein